MTFVRRADGRLLVRVTLPADVVERADEMAQASDHDRADILGDLVASQLPEVLSEAAAELLGSQSVTPPALTRGATRPTGEDQVDTSVTAGAGPKLSASGDGTET